ncbi:rhodopsin-like [Macrobrachium nipponense]|uniref:rhodopsin-like n=1 Tax=Macrobrachium nipponense TaxID=159736 RepID=UPI0030C89523
MGGSDILASTNPYGNYTVVDRVPQELLGYIHNHWYQYPPMNPLWYSLVGVFMFVTGTLAVCGNFVVIWVFMCTKSLRSPSNMFVLWFMAWTPYFVINIVGMNYKPLITPLFTIWGSVFAKANAVYNPIVYAISHPKYRAAMEKKLPCLSCQTERDEDSSVSEAASTNEKC